jgi:hypothetical protein
MRMPWLAAAAAVACAGVVAAAVPERRVLIVMDEREQMEALAHYLRDKGGLDVTIADQKSMPEDWSTFAAVIGYVHGALQEPTELKIIDYTRAGGRYVGLHHSISSGKTKNKYYFGFLGVRLEGIDKAREPAAAGDHYAWREGIDFQVVNLNPGHYITSHAVVWPERTAYLGREYPALTLKHAEVYMNVQFTDGREKTVLLGFKYRDDRNGVLYMQGREGWLKPAGTGWIVYLQMGHTTAEFENAAVAQMVLNAVNWKPGAR